jgi:hypothetical protein
MTKALNSPNLENHNEQGSQPQVASIAFMTKLIIAAFRSESSRNLTDVPFRQNLEIGRN